jgi:hypothetical protein
MIQVLFRGVPDSEMKEWEARGLVHAEMGLDWTSVYVNPSFKIQADR